MTPKVSPRICLKTKHKRGDTSILEGNISYLLENQTKTKKHLELSR